MSEILIVIPARYGSTRFLGKPLAKINGIEMLRRVANIASYVSSQFDNCSYIVATDDVRIVSFCEDNDIPSVMTSIACNSGTDRSWDVVSNLDSKPDLIVNLQGDNPLCPPDFVSSLIQSWIDDPRKEGVYTPYVSLSWDELDKLREIKHTTPYSGTTVQLSCDGYALTFSKSILPLIRNEEEIRKSTTISPVKRHIGLYAYTYNSLKNFFEHTKGIYEEMEGLEQMRFVENRVPIRVVEVSYAGRQGMSGVDSPEDIERAEEIIMKFGEFDLYE